MAALDRISIAAIGDTADDLAEQARGPRPPGSTASGRRSCFAARSPRRPGSRRRPSGSASATGIAWAFTRSPFILAVTALDIDEMSGGRFRLGPRRRRQAPERDLARVEYGRPAPHLRETIEAVRLIMQKAAHRRADPLRGRVPRHRHQGLGPPAPAGARVGADLHRRGAGGDGADGRRRRRRADRPPDVLAALARRGAGRQLRGGPGALGPRALGLRLHPDRLLRDRRRRGGALRGGPADDLPSTRPSAPTRRSGRCTASATRRPRSATRSARGDLAAMPGRDPRRDGRRLLRRRAAGQGPRAGRGGRPSAATASS